ncbi:hypothetical protein [Heyndrickxia ginsengihumi]|uniref:hypothetical protein n=1 Tax=Heyndrickxia ginsengihumi TaxID=363870 RepID=UPI0004716B5A|nr:hypothetical protein [Heyndrickxia ginsengihumi]
MSNNTNINSHMYKITPKTGWKIAVFDGKNSTTINGKEYWHTDFINSGDFIIHEVVCVMNVEIGSAREYFHIWYEELF